MVELPSGVTTMYGIVRCGQCVGMLPFVDADHVLLVRQYRYVAGRVTWEMPAMVLSGETVDAMTIIAILWADRAAHP